MQYTKNTVDGYIVSISTSDAGGSGNMTAEEYAALNTLIHAAPTAPEGCCYRLKEDLTWELAQLPQEAATDSYTEEVLLAMTNAELEQILYGYGLSANMTKTNMVRLILAVQEGGGEL